MNHKAAVLVALLIVGAALATAPMGSSAASGGHLGATCSGEGVTVTYDGTPGSETFQFVFDPLPAVSRMEIATTSWVGLEPLWIAPNKITLLELSNAPSYALPEGDITMILSGQGYQEYLYLTVKAGNIVSYDASGASGAMPFSFVEDGGSITVPECDFKSTTGARFIGWSVGSQTYQPGQTYVPHSDAVFKAMWESVGPTPEEGSGNMLVIAAIAAAVIAATTAAVIILLRRRH